MKVLRQMGIGLVRLLQTRRRSSVVAGAAVLAALYAVLGLVPISQLVGISSFITFREAVSPLIGMLLGPVGGIAVVIGVFLDFGFGRPVVFLGLDFLIDLAAALTAGFAFTGKRKAAVAFPAALIVMFLLSPSSAWLVDVGGLPVPFVWMHVASVAVVASALFLESRGRIQRLSWAFAGSVMFASTMAGHITGGILTEYVYLSQGTLFGAGSAAAYWSAVFYLYPAERILLTVLGTALSVPVMRALSRRGATARPPESDDRVGSGAHFNAVRRGAPLDAGSERAF